MVKLMAVLFALQTILAPVADLPPQEDVEALARMMYGECRGVESREEKAACAWVVCNRVDAGYADDVIGVVSAPGQFAGYDPEHPLEPELLGIARDVLIQWRREKLGLDAERVLPAGYLWFSGDGVRNYFRCEYDGEGVTV